MTPSQHRFQWFLLYIIFLCICNTYSFRGRLFWPNNVKFSNTNVGTSRRPFLLSSILSTNIPEPPVIRYLEKELQLSNDVLKKIILRFPWILYLQVTTNLQPTIEVFHAFGFKIGEIRNVVSHAPSVLAINYQWTLPEKLISIQKMFFLSQEDLIRVVVSQPYLITSSIDRNYRTASFLTNVVQFTESEVQCLITAEPRIAMSSVGVLQRCWSVLTKLYGIPAPEARALILRYPPLLSSKLMKNIKERLILFSSELNAESFPSPFVQALAHRFPPILYIDTAVFMKPNLDLLKELLSTKFAGADSVGSVKYKRIYELLQPVRLEDQRIASRFNRTELVEAARNLLEDSVHHNIVQLVKTFPQLLAYNPVKLRLMCINALYFLTGERQLDFATSAGQQLGLVQPSVANGDFYFPESGDCMNEDCVFDDIGGEFKSDGASTTRRVCSTGGGDGGGSAVEGCAEVVLAAKDLEEDVVEKWFHSSALDPQWLCSLDRISDIVSSSSPPPDIEPSTTSSSTCSSRQQSLSDGSVAWRTDDEALKVYARQGASLSMDMTRAVHILRTAPWIVSYRIVRSQGVLAALAVTLGMTNAELSKCVQTYPRCTLFIFAAHSLE